MCRKSPFLSVRRSLILWPFRALPHQIPLILLQRWPSFLSDIAHSSIHMLLPPVVVMLLNFLPSMETPSAHSLLNFSPWLYLVLPLWLLACPLCKSISVSQNPSSLRSLSLYLLEFLLFRIPHIAHHLFFSNFSTTVIRSYSSFGLPQLLTAEIKSLSLSDILLLISPTSTYPLRSVCPAFQTRISSSPLLKPNSSRNPHYSPFL